MLKVLFHELWRLISAIKKGEKKQAKLIFIVSFQNLEFLSKLEFWSPNGGNTERKKQASIICLICKCVLMHWFIYTIGIFHVSMPNLRCFKLTLDCWHSLHGKSFKNCTFSRLLWEAFRPQIWKVSTSIQLLTTTLSHHIPSFHSSFKTKSCASFHSWDCA